MDTANLLIFLILIAGVITSLLPLVPGSLVSLAGVLIYFYVTEDPNLYFVILGTLTAFLALFVDWLSGAVSAKYGGASRKTVYMTVPAGLLGFLLGGPFGLVALIFLTVLVREYLIKNSREESLRPAFYAALAVLGSSFIQAALNLSILLAFIAVLLL